MSTKDVTDLDVCRAYADAKVSGDNDVEGRLWAETGAPPKVCYRAMERAQRRGRVECGVSLRTGWLTEKGRALLAENERRNNAEQV